MGKRFYNCFSRIFNCKYGGSPVDKLINTLPFVDRAQSNRNAWNAMIKE